MLEEIFILIFGGDIIIYRGVNVRYHFLGSFDPKIKKELLYGRLNKKDPETHFKLFNQNLYNIFTGYFTLLLLMFVVGYFLI